MLHTLKVFRCLHATYFQYQYQPILSRASACMLSHHARNKFKFSSLVQSCNVCAVSNLFQKNYTFLNLARTSVCEFHAGSEPPYLKYAEPTPATYPLVNIQVQGYDFSVLQSYQAWAAKIVQRMDLNISDVWAAPCKKLEITRFEPKSVKVDDTFKLNIYERNVQVSNLPSPMLPILLEVLQAGLPEGVDLYVDHHSEEADQVRYVPNKELKELKQELAEVLDPSQAKNISKFRKK